MRIAQVSPLYESVPPACYGGTERVVSYLTEELVKLGHDVTLFANGESLTAAELVPVCDKSLRMAGSSEALAYHILMLERVFSRASEFDIIHFHIDNLHFPLVRRTQSITVTTLHGRLDLPELVPLYREFRDIPVVSISDAQRQPLQWANWQGTVYHGLPLDLYKPGDGSGGYLVFVGRISPEKRVDTAIDIAVRAGVPLKIAAKVDKVDEEYFKEVIKPLLKHPLVEFIGEVSDSEKCELLGKAYAFIFPIDWPEPFGLAMIEAMACGTPVIARRRGSVPEVVEHGVTGLVFDDVAGGVKAVEAAGRLNRQVVRRVFERRFSSRQMALNYVSIYTSLLNKVLPRAA
jgi:glycosyltransferase involved in cell wall biosynthesis